MAKEFHFEDMKFLLEALTKYFLLHSEYSLQENDWELRACINKSLKKLWLAINKEPNYVHQNWNDIKVFRMYGLHLHRKVHTAGDFSHVVE